MAAVVEENTMKINDLKSKADMQMMYCSVCKIYLNSSSQADAHVAGKSHKNKVKSVSSEGSSSADTPTMAKVTENSQLYNCDVCQKYFNSSLQLQDHMYGKGHQQKAQKRLKNNPRITSPGTFVPGTIDPGNFNPGTVNPGNVNPGTMDPGNGNPGTMNPGNGNPGTVNPGTMNLGNGNPGKLYPEALNQETSTPKNGSLNSAIKSETAVIQPTTASSKVTNVGKNLSDLFCCKRCNITLNSKKQLEQHNKGLRHKIIIGKAEPPSVGGEKWENVRYMKISNAILGVNKDTATGSGGGMNLREFHCEKCSLTVNSQTQLDQHLQSNKHKMKAVQQPNNGQNKRKRPTTGRGDGQSVQWNSKRPYQGFMPLANNFVTSNTYIPAGGGKPVYWLPPIPKQYPPQNIGSQNWTNYSYTYGF